MGVFSLFVIERVKYICPWNVPFVTYIYIAAVTRRRQHISYKLFIRSVACCIFFILSIKLYLYSIIERCEHLSKMMIVFNEFCIYDQLIMRLCRLHICTWILTLPVNINYMDIDITRKDKLCHSTHCTCRNKLLNHILIMIELWEILQNIGKQEIE